VLAICEGIERIIRTETIEGEAGAEVGSDMNRTGTEMVIIAAIGLTVLVLITIHHPVAVWLKSCIDPNLLDAEMREKLEIPRRLHPTKQEKHW